MFYQRFLLAALLSIFVLAPAVKGQEAVSLFRLERLRLTNDAELLTIFGGFDGANANVPLLSVLFETMGDDDPANDRPRFLWSHTYTRPDFAQRAAAAIPFFYFRAGNRVQPEVTSPPAPLIDLKGSRFGALRRTLWSLLQITVLDDQGFAVSASTRAYRRNANDYRQQEIHRAIAVLSMVNGRASIPEDQLLKLEARLMLNGGKIGSLVKEDALAEIAQKQFSKSEEVRGRNWELLRQRAEAEGLYFDPLAMPDGKATHAMLWVAREDLSTERKFNKQFLSIKNPWKDKRLRDWKGVVETRWLDSENRRIESNAENARSVELIPLALYGLDHPRFPALLVDFRDQRNPKWREISGRLANDVARNVLRISPFRNLPLWAANRIFNFAVKRSKADFNQPSRMRAYAQLDLLLASDRSLNPKLRNEIEKQLHRIGSNPMQNDRQTEFELAREQYNALLNDVQKSGELMRRLRK